MIPRFIPLQPGRWLYLSLIKEPWRRWFVGNGDEPSFEHAELRSPVDSNINSFELGRKSGQELQVCVHLPAEVLEALRVSEIPETIEV